MASNSADTIYEIVHNQMKYNKVGSDFGTSATQKRKEMRKKTEL